MHMGFKVKGYWRDLDWRHTSINPNMTAKPSVQIVLDEDLVRRSVHAARHNVHATEHIENDEHSRSSSHIRDSQCMCYPCCLNCRDPSIASSSMGRRSLDSILTPHLRAGLGGLEVPSRKSIGSCLHPLTAYGALLGPGEAEPGSWKKVNEIEIEIVEDEPHWDKVETQTVNEDFDMHSLAFGLYVKVRRVDMPIRMQLHAVQFTKDLLERQESLSLMEIACALKKEFDMAHGYVWHCVVGGSFGSYVTHSVGSSIYFSVGKLAVLLFKTSVPSLCPVK